MNIFGLHLSQNFIKIYSKLHYFKKHGTHLAPLPNSKESWPPPRQILQAPMHVTLSTLGVKGT